MIQILANSSEILCFPMQRTWWEALADQWRGIASRKLHKRCTVRWRSSIEKWGCQDNFKPAYFLLKGFRAYKNTSEAKIS